MKMVPNADPTSLQPGDFNSDYAAASAVQMPDQGGGGLFNQMKHAMAQAKSAQQMMQTGIAQRHYVAGSKDRVDDLWAQTATISDCAARTTTTLDLRRKTYRIVSWDQPSGASSAGGGSNDQRGSDDNTHVAVSVTNTALGSRVLSGQPTNGFRSDVVVTETKSSGESHTQNGNLLAYYSSYANPIADCLAAGVMAESGAAQGAAMMGGYARIMRALAAAGASSRFSIKQSGPPIPLGKLAMWNAMTFSAQGHDISITTENGNVRAIGANDAVFSVPSNFTQQQ